MTERAIRAVLFDLDGTLVDSLPTIADAMVEALAMHGYRTTPEELIPRIGPPMNELARDLAGITDAEAERVNDDYLRLYHERFIGLTPEHAGATELLERLFDQGMRMAVVTNKVEYGGREMVRIQDWDRFFPVVVGRDTTAAAKPSPLPARYALDALEVSAAEAAIVGDTEFDMQCGLEAELGMVIGVEGERSAHLLRTLGATHVVTSLDQVAPIVLNSGVRS